MSRSSRAAKGFLTSLIQYGAQILLQALLAPVVLKVAGRETLGAFAAIVQVLALLQLVDIGGSWSLERFLAQASGRDPSGTRFREVFTTARAIFLLTNTVFALLVLVMSVLIGRMFHLSPESRWQAAWALRVIAVWAIVRTPLAAYGNALSAMQDLAAVNLIGTLSGVLRLLASLGLVLAGGGLFGLMLAGTIAEACILFLYRRRYAKLYPSLMPSWGIPDRALLREMVSCGAHTMVLNVGGVLIARSGNLLAGLTSGAAAASTFYTSQTPGLMGNDMVQRLQDAAMPAMNELYGKGDVHKLRATILRMTRLLLVLALPLGIGILLFNRDLVIAWVGPIQYAGRLLTVSLGCYCILYAVQRVAYVNSFVMGWMKLLSGTAFVLGIGYFGLSLWLGRLLGLGGITLSLVLMTIPQTVILWTRLAREFKLNPITLVGGCFLRSLVPLGCAAGMAWLVHGHVLIRRHHLQGFLAEAITFVVIYFVLAYFFSLEDADRDDIGRHLGSVFDRWGVLRALPVWLKRILKVA